MFKVGDRVRCVDTYGTPLQHDYVYRVEEVSDSGEFLYFWDYVLDGLGGGWLSDRFVIAKPAFKGNKHATAS